MPGKRDPSQTTITVSMSKKFLDHVDRVCRTALKGVSRTQVVRDALQDYMRTHFEIELPTDAIVPPPRTDSHRLNVALNDASSTEPLPSRKGDVSYTAKKRTKKKS